MPDFSSGAPFAAPLGMEASREGMVVLVAEDDPHALSGYLEFLGRSGYVATGSADGKEALGSPSRLCPTSWSPTSTCQVSTASGWRRRSAPIAVPATCRSSG